jgi:hypothetical protein
MLNPIRSTDRAINPIPNVEKAPGPGGSISVGKSDPLKRRPHNYPVQRLKPAAAVIHVTLPKMKMQDGGGVEDDPNEQAPPDAMDLREPDDQLSPHDQQMKEIVTEAMAAIRGQHPDPEKAIQRFIDTFGEDEFEELKQMVQHAEPDDDDQGGPPDDDEDDLSGAPPQGVPGSAAPAAGGMQVGGLLHGPGAGQDDQIEAATPTGRKVLLSDGEYVVDAPTVAALGDGSTNAGARRLDQLRKAVRRQAYGSEDQAKKMKAGGRAALLEALNR